MAEVEVVAHHECATLCFSDVFLKIDADQARTDVEVEAIPLEPLPTPQVLWHKPPVLAHAALAGTALGRLGRPSAASPTARAAAGAAAWAFGNVRPGEGGPKYLPIDERFKLSPHRAFMQADPAATLVLRSGMGPLLP